MLEAMALHIAELFSIVGVILILQQLQRVSVALGKAMILFKDQI
jgi:hypothetical protein